MTGYENVILQWQNSVLQYCAHRNIPNMELGNLRSGDVYDYVLYAAYKQAKDAVDAYRKTPASPLYAKQMVRAIKQWYIVTTDSKLQKASIKIMPNNVFARFVTRTK